PATPAVAPEEKPMTAESNPLVQAGFEHARTQYLRANGEHKWWMPSLDFATQYTMLSRFNHYEDYFVTGSFKRNNATIRTMIRFSFLNAPQRDRAEEADTDALKAKKQAETARNQFSEETLRLQRSVTQMQTTHDVAELEYEIARQGVSAVQTRIDAGSANLHD